MRFVVVLPKDERTKLSSLGGGGGYIYYYYMVCAYLFVRVVMSHWNTMEGS